MSGTLNVFTLPASDLTIQGYRMNTFEPVSSGITPMESKIEALEDYVDLSRSYLVKPGDWGHESNCTLFA